MASSPHSIDDGRPLVTSADGPVDAGVLYGRYGARIRSYCLHALRDQADAEDAAQTTFLHAHRALQRGVTPQHEFAWLHTIAKNVCRQQRRTLLRKAYVTGVDLDVIPADARPDEARELVGDVRDALASLPEGQRRALLLREWQGLSSEEVAGQLGISAPATYALLTRARRSFARALTASGRAALGLHVWPLLARVKGLLGGGAVKAAAATTAVAVVAGGVALERSQAEPRLRQSRPVALSPGVGGSASATTATRRGGAVAAGSAATRPRAQMRRQLPPAWARPGRAVPATPGERPRSDAVPSPGAESAEPAGDGVEPVQDSTDPAASTEGELVPALPLPELDPDLGIVTELVPEELEPPVDDTELPDDPLSGAPSPPLPPLPPAPTLPVP